MTKQRLGPNQERWLAALESGDYRQGRCVLHDIDRDAYCCLGVAAEEFRTESTNVIAIDNNDSPCTVYDGAYAMAPAYAMYSLALHSGSGSIAGMGIDGDDASLSTLNDMSIRHFGISGGQEVFQRIADLIRENPGVYFSEPR